MDFLATPARRRALFAALYLSEGAPIGFIWLALPTWLRLAGVPITRITSLTALLVLPWTFKFAWAPLVDLFRSPRWHLKQWILTAQCVMGASLVPLLWVDLQSSFSVLVPLLFIHAVAAATQDVAIDAWCISTTDASERGRLNGWMQLGMLLGRAMFGGGALLLSTWIGNRAVVLLLLLAVCGSLALVAGARPPPYESVMPHRRRSTVLLSELRAAISERSMWLGLVFALFGGAAFKSLEVILGPFLVDRGYTKNEIGVFTAVPMIGLMILGSLAGGWLADRVARRLFVGGALVSFVVPIAALAMSDARFHGTRGPHLLAFLAATAFGIGLFTAASYALFMDLTRKEAAATQFSAFMGATNGCESWSSFAIGHLIAATDYRVGLLAMCGVSIAALPALVFMRPSARVE